MAVIYRKLSNVLTFYNFYKFLYLFPQYVSENMEQLNSLFKNLQSMKQQISSLSTSEKLDQAEKVVKAFWNAIDGDSNEFSDSKLRFLFTRWCLF